MKNDRLSAKSEIEKLVRYFEQNIYQLKSQSFNETQARQQLIDPLFEALGWDVHNRSMRPLYLQEVVPEGRVKTNLSKEVKEQEVLFETKSPAVRDAVKRHTLGKTHRDYASILDYIAEDNYKASSKEAIKKPDYRFRIKGQTKFFVEAKKPFVDLSKSMEAIFQVKRYGFSGRVPVSILTDFEEFRTFDCTHKPQFDKPKLGIIKEFDLRYEQYVEEFDRLYDTFSREAVESGSLETFTRKLLRKKTGDFALDKHFLEDLSKWREELARDIAKHPRNRRRLNDYTLNESVQRILDRIVFFRVCEDREIEVENTLLAILQMWQGRPGISLYSLLNELFKQRRALYNGLLFAPHECEELEVGNEVLLKILEGLNYPFSPYYFNEIGVEILGSIYEKFLGKTIHLTPKTVRVDEKPEVRKAGGVYYTPQYIVNYIVENTVGKLLYETLTPIPSPAGGRGVSEGRGEGRKLLLSPKQIAKLKIIDIACGSGSFLLGAFQKLIDYHVEWYQSHPKDIQTVNNAPDAYKDAAGNLYLSPRKKRDILLNNIYGVDIDRQAVEVTQMSLYLKVLEGENAETLNPQMTLALKEVYLPSLADNIKCGNSLIGTDFTAQGALFDDEMRHKVNPFDWEIEFPEIMNPSTSSGGGFDCVIGNPPYVLGRETFDESWKEYIAKEYRSYGGKFDLYVFFTEKALFLLKEAGKLGYILPNTILANVNATLLRKTILAHSSINAIRVFDRRVFEAAQVESVILTLTRDESEKSRNTNVLRVERKQVAEVSQSLLNSSEGFKFNINVDQRTSRLLDRINTKSVNLGKLSDICIGIQLGGSFGKEKKEGFLANRKKDKTYQKVLDGKDINRYQMDWPGIYVRYGNWLHRKRNEKYFLNRKIIVRQIGTTPIAMYDEDNYYTLNTIYNILITESQYDPKFILSIVNCKIGQWVWTKEHSDFKTIFPKIKKEQLEGIPIRTIDFTNLVEKQMHDELVALVEKMLELHKQLNKASFASEQEPIKRQIAATDKKIDDLVYKLYGLTEEEIKIVEGKS